MIDAAEYRLTAAERATGSLVESRQWMMAGPLGVVALVGAAVIGLVLIQR